HIFFFFFFSSRRRHTRSKRDWSSDVCSSDLTSWPAGVGLQTFKTWCGTVKEKTGGELDFKPFAAKEVVGDFELIDGVKNGVLERSEERRVGKECRCRGVEDEEKEESERGEDS